VLVSLHPLETPINPLTSSFNTRLHSPRLTPLPPPVISPPNKFPPLLPLPLLIFLPYPDQYPIRLHHPPPHPLPPIHSHHHFYTPDAFRPQPKLPLCFPSLSPYSLWLTATLSPTPPAPTLPPRLPTPHCYHFRLPPTHIGLQLHPLSLPELPHHITFSTPTFFALIPLTSLILLSPSHLPCCPSPTLQPSF